jgi:cytochrome c556
VVGSLTYYYAPATKSGKKDPAEWRTLALQMRDQSVKLAVAANKTDAAGVLKASSNLYSACNQCHTVFK